MRLPLGRVQRPRGQRVLRLRGASPALALITAGGSERAQAAVAGTLRQRGLGAGDRVAFLCGNSPTYLAALLGSLRSGIVPVPVNPALTPEERRVILDDAEPALVVEGDAELERLAEGRAVDLSPVPLARPMHYTSGTTGRPKGVWSGVLDEAAGAALLGDETEMWGFGARDRLLVCSPLYHSAPLRFSIGVLSAGGEVVVMERFDAGAFARLVDEVRPTVAFMVPSHVQRLFRLDHLPDLSSFRLVAHAGEPCPQSLKLAALEAFPDGSVWEFYGSTEGQFTACSPQDWRGRPGTVGRARPGRRLSTDRDGTIWCEAPGFARFSYWRDPERTDAAWRADAFTVGDLGRLDDEGFLFLEGRRDDLVISGGVNVYPVEVEQVLASVPGVVEVAVFGAADERWGQRVCAAVVGDVAPDDLAAHARRHLAGYKVPKDVYVVDELPRTGTGKVRRSAVASQLGLDVEGHDRG